MRLLYIIIVLFVVACKQNNTVEDITQPSPWMCTPSLSDAAWYESDQSAPLFAGMDVLHYPVTTSSPEAQQYFNQGLLFAYAFNHAEAARSFYHATTAVQNI